MENDPRRHLLSHLALMDCLTPWSAPGNAAAEPFVEALAATRRRALAAVPAYVAAVEESQDRDLKGWLEDLAALKRWADVGNPDDAPFVEAFAATRRRALDVAAELARG